ncbi:hypothetical protein F183_A04710 [Bryobacterales bacterium F-183]|nr:hypothetical protein F183_A04710 [Bryobacterales bacterium F-183]
MTRRSLLFAAAFPAIAAAQAIRREIFIKSPGKGNAVMASAYYVKPNGLDMISVEQRWSRSDTIDTAFIRRSKDNGKTWSAPVEQPTGEVRPQGRLRRHLRGYWVDAKHGAAVEIWNEGILPTDDPLEGLRQWQVYYTVSRDGFVTRTPVRMARQNGQPENSPFSDVFLGKNSITIGDQTSQPLATDNGFLLPVEITPLKPDGTLDNPGGGYTYHYSAILHATWKNKTELEWRISNRIEGDPARTTRGTIEPTLGRLRDGRYLCVMRGANDRKPELPGLRWVSYSKDAIAWTKPEPWTYAETGETFFSPSACSQLLHHSNGRLYWIGNITPQNPRGNRPRYPLVIGEVDLDTGLLRKNTVRTIDTRADGEDEILTLSNFYAREDRATREIVVHCTRLFAFPNGWEGDAYAYRITPDDGPRASVQIFVRTDCPVSNRYAPEIAAIYEQYSAKGVDFQLVYPLGGDIEKHRAEYRLPMPGIADTGRDLSRRAKASTTPQAAVFVNGQLVYTGRIDDRYVDFGKYRNQPQHRELRDALDAVLAGGKPKVSTAKAVGCAIPA